MPLSRPVAGLRTAYTEKPGTLDGQMMVRDGRTVMDGRCSTDGPHGFPDRH